MQPQGAIVCACITARKTGSLRPQWKTRGHFDAILATDPFAVEGPARYEVTEFKATRLAPGLSLPAP